MAHARGPRAENEVRHDAVPIEADRSEAMKYANMHEAVSAAVRRRHPKMTSRATHRPARSTDGSSTSLAARRPSVIRRWSSRSGSPRVGCTSRPSDGAAAPKRVIRMPCSEALGAASPHEQQEDRRRGNPYPNPPVTAGGRWPSFSRNSTRLQNHGGQLSRSVEIHLLDNRQELWRRHARYRRGRGDFPGVCLEFFACVCLWLPSKLSSENADQGGTKCLLQGFLAGKIDARARVLQTEILIHLCGYFGCPLRSLAFVGRIFRHALRQSAEFLLIGTSSKVRSDLVDSGLRPEQKQCQARLQRLVVREMFD